MLWRLFKIMQIFVLTIFCNITFAKDFGSVVNFYDIAETDALQMIKDKLSVMEKSGQLSKLQKNGKKMLSNPLIDQKMQPI